MEISNYETDCPIKNNVKQSQKLVNDEQDSSKVVDQIYGNQETSDYKQRKQRMNLIAFFFKKIFAIKLDHYLTILHTSASIAFISVKLSSNVDDLSVRSSTSTWLIGAFNLHVEIKENLLCILFNTDYVSCWIIW